MNFKLDNLITAYRNAAVGHGAAILAGDSKAANRYHAELATSLNELKGDHAKSPLLLMELLDDPNDSVAAWAATHLIRFCTDKSVTTLKRIGEKDDLIAFDAAMVLEEWEKGRFSGEEW
jgi:hypothetical protein